jgi:urease accessory protein
MKHAIAVLPAGSWPASEAAGTVTLTYDSRHRRRFRYAGADGLDLLLDLARAQLLNDGDGLVLAEGGTVLVRAAAEELMAVTAGPGVDLARLAYHLGNRHLPVQLLPDRILIRADHVIAEMITGLGGGVEPVLAPFSPEPGAYGGGHHHADEDHDHDHHHHHHHD